MQIRYPFYRSAAKVAAWHFGILILLALLPVVPGLFHRPTQPITMIDFVVDPSGLKGEGGDPEPVAPPEKVPDPSPVPPPVEQKKAPLPDEMPPPPQAEPKKADAKKTPDKAKKPEIQVSKRKVQRSVGTQNPLSAEQIGRLRALGAKVGTYNSDIPSDEQLGLGRIRDALYGAWAQPSRESVGGRTVDASIRMDLDGRILERNLTRRSGIAEFDESVERALQAVERIPGLTVAFVQKHRTVSIKFEVR